MLLFGPELYYLGLAFVIFLMSLRRTPQAPRDYQVTVVLAGIGFLVALLCLGQKGDLFFKAYRVDLFSQIFKFASFWS
jgi:NADH-quinone oxidoreductase subunit N